MLTRQYFDYLDCNGKRKTFLMLPRDHTECLHYIKELNWTLRQCFERQTGYYDAKEIVLSQDILDTATKPEEK